MKTGLIIFIFAVYTVEAQAQRYISRNGHVWFYSHTPVEDIEAHNRQVASILDASTGEIQYSLLVKSFEFKKALMQEHFNENFMESDKFPKSSFTGKITNIGEIDFSKDGEYPAIVKGDLTIHGETNPVEVKGTVTVKGDSVTTKAQFIAAPKDYKIQIPSVVERNIAKEIQVNVDVTYNKN
jgi:hypothetical protein